LTALALAASVSCAVSAPPPAAPAAAAPASVAAGVEAQPAAEASQGEKSWGETPDHPDMKAVRAALDGPQDDARKCIEPAHGPYRATIVFVYSGEVQRTEIAGSPSAAEESCIRAALQVANVGPFRRAKFTLTTTISRP
jgi:hypothetical protein